MRSLLLLLVILSCQGAHALEALLSDGSLVESTCREITSDQTLQRLLLRDVQKQPIDRMPSELIRWGTPSKTKQRERVVLIDGSVLMADPIWSAGGALRATSERVGLKRRSRWLDLERRSVATILFTLADDLPPAPDPKRDTVYLRNGDVLTGDLIGIDEKGVHFNAFGNEFTTSINRVVAIRLSQADEPITPQPIGCMIGLKDGSLVRASKIRLGARDQEMAIRILGTGGFKTPRDTLCFLQPLAGQVAYLSDLQPINYQHTPFFEIERPYAVDESLSGEHLICYGKRWVKGLAMHSASRLVYKLDGTQRRFQAEVGVADDIQGSMNFGSVTFNVYLVREGQFQLAFDSGVVRRGDQPLAVDVDLDGATAMALVVDYADQGDAGDHALWLDARLIKR